MTNYRILIARFDGSAPFEINIASDSPEQAAALAAVGLGEVKPLAKGYYRCGKAVARVLEEQA